MITVHIRKQGGAAIMTIPSDILKMLNLEVGAELQLDLTKQGFVVKPVTQLKHKRYSLKELLKGVTQKKLKTLHEATAMTRTGKPKGREIA